jgi:hypothetical protein
MHTEAQKFNLCLKGTDSGFALFTTKAFSEGDIICDVSCLWYSTMEKLKQVLSQQGNKALLDKLIAVDGLYKDDVAARFFGIRVGCGAWARDYHGVRKGGANAKIVINSHRGFTSGLCQLVVETRNSLGISQDTEICLNYGAGYDFEVLQEIQESPCKKFKGQLATLFENQEKDAKKPKRMLEEPEEKDAKKPKKEQPTPATTYFPPPKEEEPMKEEPIDPEESAIIARDVTAEGFTLKFQDDNLSIHAKTNATGNKKLPPGSCLFLFREGKIEKRDGVGGVPYHLDPKTFVMLAPNEKGGPMPLGGKALTLTEVVDKFKIELIDQHTPFVVAGQLPAKLTTDNKYWFIPKDWIFLLFVCAYVLYTITCSIWMGRGSARPHIYIYIERDIYI